MKIRNKILLISFIASVVFVSCTDMMDIHSEFIEEGEITYSVKIDSTLIYPGNNRLRVKGYLKNAAQVKNIAIKWEDADQIERIENFSYDYKQSPDSFIVDLQIAEGQYLLNLISDNALGSFSIPMQSATKVYGDKYKSYLSNREISKATPNLTGGALLTFASPAFNLTDVAFTYQTTEGTIKSLRIPPSQSELIIQDCDLLVPITYSSGYLPVETAIDTFYCEAQSVSLEYLTDVIFEFDKSTWDIIDFSSEELAANEGGGNGPAVNIIDNNNNSYWQSEWAAQTAPIPHHITIDMKQEFNVFSIDLYRRASNNHAMGVTFEGSSDGVSWFALGSLEYSSDASIQNEMLELAAGKRMRYVKVNVTESSAPPYVSLGEIYIKGKL
jgi:hypothetical protein